MMGKAEGWRRLAIVAALGAGVSVFVANGLLFFPTLGLEVDELLFARALLNPKYALLRLSMGPVQMPLMLMSYLGAFKSWLYGPLFAAFGIGVASVRVPAVILTAVTLALLVRLMSRISGAVAALFIVWMLATDTTFLVTSVFDWGPVVLQNLLLSCGLLLIASWSEQRRDWLLFAAGGVFGLATWDKALFLWNLSAMSVCCLLVCGRSLAGYPRKGRMALLAGAGLLLGALPLVVYNARHRGSTVQANAHLSGDEVGSKFDYLLLAIDGKISSGAFSDFHYPADDLVRRPFEEVARETGKAFSFSSWYFSSWRLGLVTLLLPAGLLRATPPQRKWILFFISSAALAWLESALTIGAGRSIHHAVLIWPLLYAGVALSAAAAAASIGRYGAPVALVLLAVFAIRGLLLINATYANLLSYSPPIRFSNADQALGDFVRNSGARWVFTMDWGIGDLVAVRTRDSVRVVEEDFRGADPLLLRDLLACQASECLVVAHPDAREILPHGNEFFYGAVEQNHRVRELVREIDDSHGTPTFEVFRLWPATGESDGSDFLSRAPRKGAREARP